MIKRFQKKPVVIVAVRFTGDNVNDIKEFTNYNASICNGELNIHTLEGNMIAGCLGYEYKLLSVFQRLLMCRDAYWKIAGDEMGLGKPWEPDWLDDDTKKYIITSSKVFGTFGGLGYINYILTFPTEEMRDAFYENFKELIEECKELL